MTQPDVRELFRATVLHPPLDQLDVDRAVRTGGRRRRLRIGATLASVAVVVVIAGTVVLSALSVTRTAPAPTTATASATSASPTPSQSPIRPTPSVSSGQTKALVPSDFPSPPASLPNSPVIKVSPGERVDIGGGAYLTLSAQEKCVTFSDDVNFPQCKSLTDGNQARGSVGLQGRGGEAGTYVTGVYSAPNATKIVLTRGNEHWVMSIVKLRGGGKNIAFFLTLPPGTLTFDDEEQITVYNGSEKPVSYLHQPRGWRP